MVAEVMAPESRTLSSAEHSLWRALVRQRCGIDHQSKKQPHGVDRSTDRKPPDRAALGGVRARRPAPGLNDETPSLVSGAAYCRKLRIGRKFDTERRLQWSRTPHWSEI